MKFTWRHLRLLYIYIPCMFMFGALSIGQPACQSDQDQDFIKTYTKAVPLGGSAYIELNLTELGFNHADYFKFARHNISYPVMKLKNDASVNVSCLPIDNQFLESLNDSCKNHFSASLQKRTRIVNISVRQITQAIAGKYIFLPYYRGPTDTNALVQIIICIEDSPDTTSDTTPAPLTQKTTTNVQSSTEITTELSKKTVAPIKNQGVSMSSRILVPFIAVFSSLSVRALVFFISIHRRRQQLAGWQ